MHRIDLILHILIELNGLHAWSSVSVMPGYSETTKMPFWMIQIAKNEVFSHFLEFWASDRLQIAYFDYTKWSWQVGCHIAHAGSFKNHKNAFLNDPKSQKWVFLAIFMILVHRINFKLHVLIILNNVDKWAVITPMQDHSKITKMSFWMIKRAKIGFLTIFGSLVSWIDLTLYIMKGIYALQHLSALPDQERSFKNQKNAFMNDPNCQKWGFWPFS